MSVADDQATTNHDVFKDVVMLLRQHVAMAKAPRHIDGTTKLHNELVQDSMEAMSLAMHIENHFEICLHLDASENPDDVDALVAYISGALQEKTQHGD